MSRRPSPAPSRAARRRAAAEAARAPATDAASLRVRLKAAKLPGTPPALADRARAALDAYVASAEAHAMPFAEIAARLADGRAAEAIAGVEAQEARRAGRDPMAGAACAAGCAFCCVLTGADGGTITEAEARRLHAALAPLAGRPDGRDWHARACPALDPGTRTCRAYEARPRLCRAYHSRDAAACEAHVRGEAAAGAGLTGDHPTFLAVHGLARAALAGRADVPSFALAALAAAAVEGADAETALARARHPSGALDAERRRTGKAWRAAATRR
jgi:hypothetical protein